jgi:hypothetical protein
MSGIDVRTEIRSQDLEQKLAAAGKKAPVAIARALNRAGTPTQNAYTRQVKKTLGLKAWRYGKKSLTSAIMRKTSTRRANASRLTYSFAGWGQGFNLAYYDPKETPAGATANWLGQRKMVAKSFYLGGRFPKRKKSKLSHAVFRRTGKGRWTLDRPKGPGLPEAMVHPVPAAVWQQDSRRRLTPALMHELQVILAGIA